MSQDMFELLARIVLAIFVISMLVTIVLEVGVMNTDQVFGMRVTQG